MARRRPAPRLPVHPSAGRAEDGAAARRRPGSGLRPTVLFLPARNEAPRIEAVLRRVPDGIVTIVVDDGSTDGTADVAVAAGAKLVETGGIGLGGAVRAGLRAAVELDARAVAFCDADGEYDPAELPALLAPILDGRADYVVGSRFAGRIEHMHPHRRFGNRLLTIAVRLLTHQPVTDGQSGFRALSGEAAASARVAHDYNYAQVLTIELVQKGFRYAEVPITYRFRTSGRSFVRLPTYLRHVVPAVARLVLHDVGGEHGPRRTPPG